MRVRRIGRRTDRATWPAAICLILVWVGPAAAGTGVVSWPTFFRTGPGDRFVVLEELARGEVVEVQSCAGHWCQVQVGRVVGYVDQANLGQQAPPSMFTAPAANSAGCFDSWRAGYQGGDVFRYCPR